MRHGVDHAGHLPVAAVQGALDAGGARLEDHLNGWARLLINPPVVHTQTGAEGDEQG